MRIASKSSGLFDRTGIVRGCGSGSGSGSGVGRRVKGLAEHIAPTMESSCVCYHAIKKYGPRWHTEWQAGYDEDISSSCHCCSVAVSMHLFAWMVLALVWSYTEYHVPCAVSTVHRVSAI